MSNVKKGKWGTTEMARYAIANLGVVGISEESLRKGIARKLKEKGISNKAGQLIFSEARAKRLLGVDLDEYIRKHREKTVVDERYEKEAAAFVKGIPELPPEYSAQRPIERAIEFEESIHQDDEPNKGAAVAVWEVNQAELLFLFKYLLEKDGVEFDRAGFRKDYREAANVNRDLRSLVRQKERGEDIDDVEIEDKRILEAKLRDKLTECSSYIHQIDA